MKILLVPDSFKDSLSAQSVVSAMQLGVKEVSLDSNIILQPIADGGEGTIEALLSGCGGELISEKTCDPLSRVIQANYAVLANGLGVIELAQASGLSLLLNEERNPLLTSSFGTGKQILSILEKGIKHLIIGLGGSATNDGGIGILYALGYRFYDKDKNELDPIGRNLVFIASVSRDKNTMKLDDVKLQLAVDVTNPLCGEKGASAVFGPQKGADQEMVKQLEKGLRNFHSVASRFLNKDLAQETAGFGAAGGIAFGLVAFLNAEIVSGIEFIGKQVQLEEKIKSADLIISGEGKIDTQSLDGKVISGIAKLTTKYKKPLVLLGGVVELSNKELDTVGVTAAFSVSNQPMELKQAMEEEEVKRNIQFTTSQVLRLFNTKC